MRNYWILVVPRNHAKLGINQSFAQSNHGKSNPLRRMQRGDGVLYYSPKLELGNTTPCQSFTGIGCVLGEKLYHFDAGRGKLVCRRHTQFLPSKDAPIAPLINRLHFIKDKTKWGHIFKFEALRISGEDFKLIAAAMNVRGLQI